MPNYPHQFATLKVEGKKSGVSFAACAFFISTAEQFKSFSSEPRRKACKLDGLLFFSRKPIEEARLKHDSVSGQRRRGARYATKNHGELAGLGFLFKTTSLGLPR